MNAGRRRRFDKEQALEAAMKVFWRNGFAGTSMSDLTEALGVNKPSLYAAFGNKEQLFHRALQYYGEHLVRPHLERLAGPEDTPLRQRLSAYLHSVARMLTDPTLPGGCFIAQTAGECLSHAVPRTTATTMAKANANAVEALAALLARDAGSLPSDTSPRDYALYILAQLFAMSALARSGMGYSELESVIGLVLGSLPD
jgi:AcrR family transcriptional regulator